MKKNGFTLIELLAVIVILAILALIVSPIISGVISDARMQSAARSLEGYVSAINLAQVKYQSKNGGLITTNLLSLDVSGKNINKVVNQEITFDNNGQVVTVEAEVDGFYCIYHQTAGAVCSKIKYSGILANNYLEKVGITTKEQKATIMNVNFYNDGRTFMVLPIDVSEEGNGNILLYKVVNSNDSTKYDLNIVGNGKVYFPVDSSNLLSFGYYQASPTEGWFSALESINFNKSIDTALVTNMDNMFSKNIKLNNLDLSEFNTINVTNMYEMLSAAGAYNTNFTLNLGDNFDTSKVTTMNGMFHTTGRDSTKYIVDLKDKFNTSNVTDMGRMFYNNGYSNENFTINLGNSFNTSKVTKMNYMFFGVGIVNKNFVLDLKDKFDTSRVINMDCMFYDLAKNGKNFVLDLGNKFNTSEVTSMVGIFEAVSYYGDSLTINFGDKFITSKLIDTSYMFDTICRHCNSFEIDMPDTFTTSNVTNMYRMFYMVESLTKIRIKNLDFSKVNNVREMLLGVPTTTQIIINENAKNWINTNFPEYTNIIVEQ